MKTYQTITTFLLAIALLSTSACDEENERSTDVKTLRILAVQAETPFAKPGVQVPMHMLAHDGSASATLKDGSRRPVELVWIGGCVNPAGDSYTMCLPFLHEVVKQAGNVFETQQVPEGTPGDILGWGTDFTAEVPQDIISSRAVADGVVNPYGLQFIFVAACAGHLRPIADAKIEDFPLGCFDDNGTALGRDDFDLGYYPLYVYDNVTNTNPQIQGMVFNGTPAGDPCAESKPCPAGQKCGSEAVCIPVVSSCGKSDADDCDEYPVALGVPESVVELGVLARVSASDAKPESVWVNYYAYGGSFKNGSSMINDANSGWTGDFNGKWRADVPSGTQSRIWAVVRDNRNGVTWRYQDIWVQ